MEKYVYLLKHYLEACDQISAQALINEKPMVKLGTSVFWKQLPALAIPVYLVFHFKKVPTWRTIQHVHLFPMLIIAWLSALKNRSLMIGHLEDERKWRTKMRRKGSGTGRAENGLTVVSDRKSWRLTNNKSVWFSQIICFNSFEDFHLIFVISSFLY